MQILNIILTHMQVTVRQQPKVSKPIHLTVKTPTPVPMLEPSLIPMLAPMIRMRTAKNLQKKDQFNSNELMKRNR